MLDFAIAITNVIGVGIKSFDDPGSKQARGHKKSQSQRKRAKNHKKAKNSKRSKNHDTKKNNKKNRRSSKGSDGKVDERKRKTTYYDDDDDEQPADKVTGGERPLGEKLPDGFEVKRRNGSPWNLTGAIELHRLVLEDYDQLKKQKDEITKTIIDSTCAIDDEHDGHYKEVIQMPLPLLPRSRHCSSLVGSELIKPLKQRPYS